MRIAHGPMKWMTMAAVTMALGAAAGCHVDTHKSGETEDVKIATPFGGISVKTNEDVVEGGVGLSIYPGATLEKGDKKHDNGAADVNLNFGSFHLGVKSLSYKTTDPPDKVMAFYRKDMARYGVVIQCQDNRPVGKPDRTQDGLSCVHNDNSHMQVDDNDAKKDQLKAGSISHQHIVAINSDGSGTKIGLIALDLPGKLLNQDDDKQ